MYIKILTEEFIGVVFKQRMKESSFEYSIEISELITLSNTFTSISDVRVRITTNDIYDMVTQYNNIFSIQDKSISMIDESINRFKYEEDIFNDLLDSYFCAGIPENIYKDLVKLIKGN